MERKYSCLLLREKKKRGRERKNKNDDKNNSMVEVPMARKAKQGVTRINHVLSKMWRANFLFEERRPIASRALAHPNTNPSISSRANWPWPTSTSEDVSLSFDAPARFSTRLMELLLVSGDIIRDRPLAVCLHAAEEKQECC